MRRPSELIAGRAFDFINFTGSVRGGQEIERAAAGTFVGTGLELGGKDPGYVRADAEPRRRGRHADGRGDVQLRPVLLRHRADLRAREPLRRLRGEGGGLGLEATGSAARSRRRRRSGRWRRSASPTPCAARSPRRSRPGRGRWSTRGSFPPTPATAPISRRRSSSDVDHSMRVMTEESFGPVVGIMPVRDDEEAIRLMNDCRYGLTASVWTGDTDAAAEIGARIETGTVFMNRADYLDPALCWTGGQGDRPRRGAVASRLSQRDAAEVLPPAEALSMVASANWNYPTAIRFGAGRIDELGDACPRRRHRPAALRHRPRRRAAADRRSGRWSGAGGGRARRRRSSPTCSRTRPRRTSPPGSRCCATGGHDGVDRLRRRLGARLRQGHRLHARADPADVGLRGHRRLVDPRRPGRDRADRRGADHRRHRLGGRARRGDHQPRDADQEGDLPPEDDAGAGDPRPRADGRPAAAADRRHRHGRLRPLPRGLRQPRLPPDGGGDRGRGAPALQGLPAARLPQRRRPRGAGATCWPPRRWGPPPSRRGSAPSTRCRIRWGRSTTPTTG